MTPDERRVLEYRAAAYPFAADSKAICAALSELDETKARVEELERRLRPYTHCYHAVPDCACTTTARHRDFPSTPTQEVEPACATCGHPARKHGGSGCNARIPGSGKGMGGGLGRDCECRAALTKGRGV